MKEPLSQVTVQPHLLEQCYPWEEQPVLTLQLSLPQVTGEGRGARRINRYYRHLEQLLLKWARHCHPSVCAMAQAALEACRPLPSFCIRTEFQVTYQDDTCLSILWHLETAGVRESFADLWELPGGTPLDRKALLPRPLRSKAWKKSVLLTEEGVCVLEGSRPVLLASRRT